MLCAIVYNIRSSKNNTRLIITIIPKNCCCIIISFIYDQFYQRGGKKEAKNSNCRFR